jgi:hypothetical protein
MITTSPGTKLGTTYVICGQVVAGFGAVRQVGQLPAGRAAQRLSPALGMWRTHQQGQGASAASRWLAACAQHGWHRHAQQVQLRRQPPLPLTLCPAGAAVRAGGAYRHGCLNLGSA